MQMNKKTQIPVEVFNELPQIEFSGNKEVAIEGCKSIVEYDESMVKIRCKYVDLIFFGTKLNIQIISPQGIIIDGDISNVEFIKNGKK
jgi:sporulation protein YqfC